VRLLYCAIDQTVPGTTGGSVHVGAVAGGLAALGHDVHVLATPGEGGFPSDGVEWIPMAPPFGAKQLRWTRTAAVTRLARARRPAAIIERYYNFGGEGISAAAATGALAVLEVNSPAIDHPGSRKRILDKALLVEPMRRWRDRLCASADLVISPSAAILPATAAGKIVEIEWGADTLRFHPGAAGRLRVARPAGVVAVLAGAFRSWHGAIHLVRAIRLLRERGRREIAAILIGEGPELPAVRAAAEGLEDIVFAGAIPHAEMPGHLAAADIGVAPFDVAAHAPLALGFYWSPLKIFEYMATGLPVVAPRIDRIAALVRHDLEGLLYAPPDETGLAGALDALTDPSLRARLGPAARARAVAEFSWSAHCRVLESAITAALRGRRERHENPSRH
jgi:glycosyltransferase involved in cell wall biosynthesis